MVMLLLLLLVSICPAERLLNKCRLLLNSSMCTTTESGMHILQSSLIDINTTVVFAAISPVLFALSDAYRSCYRSK